MAIRATEILDKAFGSGEKTSAGQSSISSTRRSTVTAQYPAERSAGNDAAGDLRVHDLYKNGLLFTAYDMSSRTSPDLRNMRQSQLDRKSVV